ncbi:unnamed protein product, partial [Vitis vinifera]
MTNEVLPFQIAVPQGQQPLIKVRLDKKGLLILLFGYRIFFSDPVISHLKLGCHYIFCSRFIQRNAANHPSPLPWTQGPPKLQLSPLELPSLFFQTLYLQCPALNHLVKSESRYPLPQAPHSQEASSLLTLSAEHPNPVLEVTVSHI